MFTREGLMSLFSGIIWGSVSCILLLAFISPVSLAKPSRPGASRVVAIDAGHSAGNPGAFSARGVGEYSFNSTVAGIVLEELKKQSRICPVLINRDGDDISLSKRIDLINQENPDLLVSIHHDSVQPFLLEKWKWEGKSAYYCDRYSGFSVFYSGKNEKPAESLRLALLLGRAMVEEGYQPSLHHAEKIKGENRPIVDKQKGVYRFDDLAILRSAKCPGVLLECGIIKNRRDELLLRSNAHQLKISAAIIRAVAQFTAEIGQDQGSTSAKAPEH